MNPDETRADPRFRSRGELPPGGATTMKCSYCGLAFARAESGFVPFCSRRCQQLDLRNWLTESYGMPWEGEAEDWDEAMDFEDDDDEEED